jgi:hypothetical protein
MPAEKEAVFQPASNLFSRMKKQRLKNFFQPPAARPK